MMLPLTSKNCLLCGAVAKNDFCPPCYACLPRLSSPRCAVCALPGTGSDVCGACLAHPPAFDRSRAAVSYAFPVDALLHSFKYRSTLALASVLADLLVENLETTELPDFIVPMPLHPARLRERGFNQALELARHVSKRLRVPLLPTACRRIRDTPSQTGLPWKEREKNMSNAFSCETADLAGSHIALLDDVMTTGATLNELANVLRKHGTATVSAWVVARTLSGDSLAFQNSATG